MSKYDPLYAYLKECGKNELHLSFDEIEKILQDKLPNSAHRHVAWWSNSKDGSHPHNQSWQDAGYHTEDVSNNMAAEKMVFVKNE